MNAKPTFTMANFEVLELLGRGGMSSVWKARQLSLDRMVAIKILSSKFSEESDDLERFRMEARAAARLKHPNIVQVYDANFKDGIYYFVMELVDGYTMGELQRRKGKTSEGDALTIAEAVAVALNYAWGGFEMVHNDINADNIMVDEHGSLKVTDLGLLSIPGSLENREETPPKNCGKPPSYMSPGSRFPEHPPVCIGPSQYLKKRGGPLCIPPETAGLCLVARGIHPRGNNLQRPPAKKGTSEGPGHPPGCF